METQLLFLVHHQNYIHKSNENNTPNKIYVTKWKQITYEMKDEYLPKLLILAAGKLLGSTESKNKRPKWRKCSKMKSCVYCNVVNNDYQ